MNHLLRGYAPITDAGWRELDATAKERLVPLLAARRVVDFSGPKGFEYSATALGRVTKIEAPGPGLRARQRRVLPLVELRVDFSVSREELLDLERGAEDIDLEQLEDAAICIAEAENRVVFHGWEAASIEGITQAADTSAVELQDSAATYPLSVATALQTLQVSGIEGPYALALEPELYTRAIATTEQGATIIGHLMGIVGGPVFPAPGITGGVLMSQRGDDFCFESGQDLSIGYSHHDSEMVHLYLEETFSFLVVSPEAAVQLSV